MTRGLATVVASLAALALSGCAVVPVVAGDRPAEASSRAVDPASASATATSGTTTPGTTTPGTSSAADTSTTGSTTASTTASTPRGTGTGTLDEILGEFSARQTGEGAVVTLGESILFGVDSATLTSDAAPVLDRLGDALVLAGKRRVVIRGHTDSRGDDAYNLDLSTRRAAAVRDYLVGVRGLTPDRFEVVGVGEAEPVAPEQLPDGGDDAAGRERNRRVEVLIRDP